MIQDDKACKRGVAREEVRGQSAEDLGRERCPACDEGLRGVGRDADFLGPKPIPDPNSKLGLLKRRNSGEKELTPTVPARRRRRTPCYPTTGSTGMLRVARPWIRATHPGAWGLGLVSTLTHGAARHRVMRQPLT